MVSPVVLFLEGWGSRSSAGPVPLECGQDYTCQLEILENCDDSPVGPSLSTTPLGVGGRGGRSYDTDEDEDVPGSVGV